MFYGYKFTIKNLTFILLIFKILEIKVKYCFFNRSKLPLLRLMLGW